MPCSAKLRSCVDDLIAQGKPESSAWAICRSQLGEKLARHRDFERIHNEFITYYKDHAKGESEYYSWLHALKLDESEKYGAAKESFQWAKDMISLLKEDAENKYYQVLIGFPTESMNGNVYHERDLIAAALALKGKCPSLNHKDEFWFSEENPRNHWGILPVVDAKYEDGAVEAILQVPKTAVCPICNGSKMTELIDEKKIVNVSLEGKCASGYGKDCQGFEFTNPPFTLLTVETLPGIPLARIKPLESIMVEALHIADETQNKQKEKRKVTKVEAKIKEYTTSTNTPMGPIPPLQRDESPARGHDDPVRPVLPPAEPETVLGTPAAPDDQHFMKSGPEYGHQGASPSQPGKVVHSPNPTEEANTPERISKGSSDYPPSAASGTDGGVPKPEDIRSGPSKSSPPQRNLSPRIFEPVEQPAPLPSSVVPEVERGKNVVSRGVLTGTSPVEVLPSLEERKARIHAELKAKSAEEKALAWEQKHGEVYAQLQEITGRHNQLSDMYRTIVDERDTLQEAITKATIYSSNYDKLNRSFGELTEKYNRLLKEAEKANLGWTKANEDYLEVSQKLEEVEGKLKEARDKAKKIVRISV